MESGADRGGRDDGPGPRADATPGSGAVPGPDDGPGSVGAVRRDIRDRLDELAPAVAEAERLRAALAVLVDAAPTGPAPRERPRRERAPRGARSARLLAAVREHPGVSQRELAPLVGTTPAGVYGLVRRAVLKGQVVKRDGRLHPC